MTSKAAYSDLFNEWTERVDRLEALTDSDGDFMLYTHDYFETLQNCPNEHVKFYLIGFLRKAQFLIDESIVLANGQLFSEYQKEMYKKFVVTDPQLNNSFVAGLKQSSRTSPGASLSLCSGEGLSYLFTKNMRVCVDENRMSRNFAKSFTFQKFTQAEQLMLPTYNEKLQDCEMMLKRMVERRLYEELRGKKLKKVTVTLLSGDAEISYQHGNTLEYITGTDFKVRINMYGAMSQREIPSPVGYSAPPCTARLIVEAEQKAAKDKAMADVKLAWKQPLQSVKLKKISEFAAELSSSPTQKSPTISTAAAAAVANSQMVLVDSPKEDELESTRMDKSFTSPQSSLTADTQTEVAKRLFGTSNVTSSQNSESEAFLSIKNSVTTPTRSQFLLMRGSEESRSTIPDCLKQGLTGSGRYQSDIAILKRRVKVIQEDETSEMSVASSSPDVLELMSSRQDKKQRTTSYVKAEYSSYSAEVAMFMSAGIDKNKKITVAEHELAPTDKNSTEYKEWAERAEKAADSKLMGVLVKYVYQSLILATALESAVIEYVIRKREIAGCPPEMLLEFKSWNPIFDVVTEKFKSAITDRDELEIEALNRAAELKIENFVAKSRVVAATAIDADEVEEMDSAAAAVYNSIAETQKQSLSEFKQLVQEETKAAKGLIAAARKNIIRNLNTVVHNALVKTICFSAQAQQCMDQVPAQIVSAFLRLIKSKDYNSVDGANHLKRFQECVSHIKVKPEHIKKLISQIVGKSPRSALKEGSPLKSQSSVPSATNSPGSASTTSEGSLNSNSTAAAIELLPGQTKMTSYYTDLSSPQLISDEASAEYGNLFYLTSVVTSYDEAIKTIMRNVSHVDDGFFVGLDCSSCKTQDILNRLLLFRLILEQRDGEVDDMVEKVFSGEMEPLVRCVFAVSSNSADPSNIKPDGLCFYRTLYQLYLRHWDRANGFDMSVTDMSARDKKINNLDSTIEHREFVRFLEGIKNQLVTPSDRGEVKYDIKNTDHIDFEETVELVLAAIKKKPGCMISSELWGVNLWTKTLSFPVNLFSACSSSDHSPLSLRLYGASSPSDNLHWNVFSFASNVPEDFFSLTLRGLRSLMSNPNFMALKDSHFFLLRNPSVDEAAVVMDNIQAGLCTKLLEGIQTVANPRGVLSSLDKIIESLTERKVCSVTADFDLKEMRTNVSQLWPDAIVNHDVEVIDLIKEVVARTPAKKSVEHQTIEILETKVKHLQARCRAYKKLLEDSMDMFHGGPGPVKDE